MFKSVIITCRLHVHDVFDIMFVMAMPCQVKSEFKFFFRGFIIMLVIISRSFLKFWAEA